MKKNVASIARGVGLAMLLAVCLALSGCGQRAAQEPKPCADIASAIAQTPGIFEELISQERAETVAYLGIDGEALADSALWMDASAATTELVAVLTVADEKAMQALEDDVERFLQDMIDTYRDYAPDEVPKLKSALVEVRGRQLALIISKDAEAAKASLDAAMKP